MNAAGYSRSGVSDLSTDTTRRFTNGDCFRSMRGVGGVLNPFHPPQLRPRMPRYFGPGHSRVGNTLAEPLSAVHPLCLEPRLLLAGEELGDRFRLSIVATTAIGATGLHQKRRIWNDGSGLRVGMEREASVGGRLTQRRD
jgi:hypothetical protein